MLWDYTEGESYYKNNVKMCSVLKLYILMKMIGRGMGKEF